MVLHRKKTSYVLATCLATVVVLGTAVLSVVRAAPDKKMPPKEPARIEAFVQGDSVNLRATSNTVSEVVAQANYGDTLVVKAVFEEWVQVEPPGRVGFWVHGDYLHSNRFVKVKTLNMRAGPGTHFSLVGKLSRNEEVKVVEEFGEWRKVRPTKDSGLWVSREFLRIRAPKVVPTPVSTSTPKKKPTAIVIRKPVPTPTPVTIIKTVEKVRIVEVTPPPPTPTPKIVAPQGLKLLPIEGQGMRSIRKGRILVYLMAGDRPTRIQLMSGTGNKAEVRAYLMMKGEEAETFAGKMVQVDGRDFWVESEKVPVTVPKEIKVVE